MGAFVSGAIALSGEGEGESLGMVVFPVLTGAIGMIFGPFVSYDLYEIHMDEVEPDRSGASGSAGDDENVQPRGSLAATPPNVRIHPTSWSVAPTAPGASRQTHPSRQSGARG